MAPKQLRTARALVEEHLAAQRQFAERCIDYGMDPQLLALVWNENGYMEILRCSSAPAAEEIGQLEMAKHQLMAEMSKPIEVLGAADGSPKPKDVSHEFREV